MHTLISIYVIVFYNIQPVALFKKVIFQLSTTGKPILDFLPGKASKSVEHDAKILLNLLYRDK